MKWKTTYLKKKKSEHADVYSTKYPVIESSKVWFDIFFVAKWKKFVWFPKLENQTMRFVISCTAFKSQLLNKDHSYDVKKW